jgi:hypothetical protein
MTIIRPVHRYLGEALLLVALAGVILALIGLVRKEKLARAENLFGMAYAGLLDLQALLGLVQFLYLLVQGGTGLVSSLFIVHPVLMVLALMVVHASREWRDREMPVRHRAQLVSYGLSLLLILGGRLILV